MQLNRGLKKWAEQEVAIFPQKGKIRKFTMEFQHQLQIFDKTVFTISILPLNFTKPVVFISKFCFLKESIPTKGSRQPEIGQGAIDLCSPPLPTRPQCICKKAIMHYVCPQPRTSFVDDVEQN